MKALLIGVPAIAVLIVTLGATGVVAIPGITPKKAAANAAEAYNEKDEKLVLEYAEGISRTPVEVSDELFDRLRARFDDAQIVELTTAAAIENFRARFNWALGIGSQDYTAEGAYCLRPEVPAADSRAAA